MEPTGLSLLDSLGARAGDAAAVAAGTTWAALMERAAGHLAAEVRRVAGDHRVVVAVGKGNNGGDGWAAAGRLADAGLDAAVVSSAPLDVDLSDEAAAHRRSWRERGGATAVGAAALRDALADGPVVAVDCLLGTGIDGAPRGEVGAMCEVLRDAPHARVVACDIPSRVASDTGAAPAPAVRADVTVTFGALKRGLVLHPGRAHAGEVVVGSLGDGFAPPPTPWAALTAATAAPPRLDAAADKRARGVTLAVAGSVGTAGAAILCTRGLLYGGAGLVTLATPAHVQRVIAPVVPSAMTRPLRHAQAHLGADAVDQLDDVDGFDVVVAGPGLGPTDGVAAVVDHLRGSARRLVLDADAINVHRDDPARLADHAGALVLTPHEREFARIGGGDDGPDAWAHRLDRAAELAAAYDATILVKGPGTLVAAPDGRCWATPVGGPELGTGGTGDVLAGLVGAAIAVADDVPLAVARAAWWHGFAGGWLAAGRPEGPPPRTPRASMAGFGPAEVLAAALPDALRALAALAAHDPTWPFTWKAAP